MQAEKTPTGQTHNVGCTWAVRAFTPHAQDVGFKDAGNVEDVVNEYFNRHFPDAVCSSAACWPCHTAPLLPVFEAVHVTADSNRQPGVEPAGTPVPLHDAREDLLLLLAFAS